MTLTAHHWPDDVHIWTLDSPYLDAPLFFVSAQSAADYLFQHRFSAHWITLNHDHA